MLFGKHHVSVPPFSIPICNINTPRPCKSSHKDPGLWISNDLSLSFIRFHAATKATRITNFLRPNISHLTPELFKLIFASFIRPHFEYCAQAWVPTKVKDRTLLENVQRRFSKQVVALRPHDYQTRRSRLNIFPTHYRRVRGCIILCFQLYLRNELFNFFSPPPVLHLRGHQAKLYTVRPFTSTRKHFFSHFIVPYWNLLPMTIFDHTSLKPFKKSLDLVLPSIIDKVEGPFWRY